jgi:carbamoyl-phosphate synthase large subunit
MRKAGLDSRAAGARSIRDAVRIQKRLNFPFIIRPSRTLGGSGGNFAFSPEDFKEVVQAGLSMSPVHEVLIEESVMGWKEFELEVMRDHRDNVVIICSIENLDPMGVHTGDSITVAPAQTLTDKEYQIMRDAALRVIREIGVDTGGSNIQFAVNPKDGRMVALR